MKIDEEFFEWMYQLVEGKKYSRLLHMLYEEEFFAIVPLDDNRVLDGACLRYRFGDEANIPRPVIDKIFEKDVCSILEMMIALALRVEKSLMEDDDFGDRTNMWFWMMIKSLGLYDMVDDNFNEEYVRHTMSRFLHRDYEPDGTGSLFTVKNTTKDLRDLDIWYQMCLFFDNLL